MRVPGQQQHMSRFVRMEDEDDDNGSPRGEGTKQRSR